MKQWVSILLTIAVVALGIWYIYGHINDFITLFTSIQWYLIFVICLLRTLNMVVNGFFIKASTNCLLSTGQKLGRRESVYLSVVSSIGNFFSFFQAGLGIRAVYMKKKIGMPYHLFIASSVIGYVFMFFVFGLAGMVGVMSVGYFDPWLFLGLLMICVAGPVLILFPFQLIDHILLKSPESMRRLWKNLKKSLELTHDVIYRRPSISTELLFLMLIRFSLSLLVQFLILYSCLIKISFSTLLIYSAIAGLSILINLTPAAIGLREGLFLLVHQSLEMGVDQILQAAILDRTTMVVVLFLLYFIVPTPKIDNKETQNNEHEH